jgi:hypothetical protein
MHSNNEDPAYSQSGAPGKSQVSCFLRIGSYENVGLGRAGASKTDYPVDDRLNSCCSDANK